MIALDSEAEFLLCLKCEKWVIFGPKVTTFELFFKSIHQVFLKSYQTTCIKNWSEVFYYLQNEIYKHLWTQINILNFSLNRFSMFFSGCRVW